MLFPVSALGANAVFVQCDAAERTAVYGLSGFKFLRGGIYSAGKCDFDIDISYNRIIIDAKSILGILSMDLTRELTVRCYGESKRFNEVIAKFAVA